MNSPLSQEAWPLDAPKLDDEIIRQRYASTLTTMLIRQLYRGSYAPTFAHAGGLV